VVAQQIMAVACGTGSLVTCWQPEAKKKTGWIRISTFSSKVQPSDLTSSHRATPPQDFTISQQPQRLGAKPQTHCLWGTLTIYHHPLHIQTPFPYPVLPLLTLPMRCYVNRDLKHSPRIISSDYSCQ
jgi:hypothetical protein